MIKKINILLIVSAIIGSVYIVLSKSQSPVLVLKDLSIILTINALYIIQKITKIKLSDKINLIYILFIFIAHFLGTTCELYNKIYWFDKFTHFLSGIVSGIGAILILKKSQNNNSLFFNILFIISLSLMVASMWEMLEYTFSCLFDVDPQRVKLTGVSDTMGDIIVAFLASILVSITYYFKSKKS